VRGPTRLGMAMHGAVAGIIDLGNDPPLSINDEGEAERAPVRRAVSLRWLAGTILTGFTSIFLMGGALMVALNNPNQFATAPDNSKNAGQEVTDAGLAFGQKGDRIKPLDEEVASRQILQVSTVTRQGERDFIKLRPFAKVSATLVTHKLEQAAEIPPYDALRIFADTSAPAADTPDAPVQATASNDNEIYAANVDGEVSVKVSPFPIDNPEIDTADGLPTADVEQIVRAAAHFAPDANTQVAALPYVDSARFNDANSDPNDPFSALGVRIIPENVSNVAKSDASKAPDNALAEKIVTIVKGQSFRSLLQENDVAADDVDEIIAALSELVDLNHLHAGQKVRIALAGGDVEGATPRPMRVSLYDETAHQATIARADDNTFVRADEPTSGPDEFAEVAPPPETDSASGMPKLYDAIYETALEQQVPKPLIDQLIRVFAYDVDYQTRITPGDAIEVFHSLPDAHDPEASEPEVLFASLTLGGITKRFYRFRTPDDGFVDYYDDEGKSAKKFLMRKPMTMGIIRSGFGWRVHPILGYRRLHTGVDYAAPRGTPIMAAGNGIVEKAGWSSGYGQFTLVKHTNGYETAYGHQSLIAKGIVPGARVHQGQIIGYVGSTGLSTGPHLHFEVRVNGSPVDPLRIRLPRGRVLQGDLLAGFDHERDRIDSLLGTPASPAKVASAATN
jgi:murein DD-endopeptidase MepM/ murein hydrolase activator NlpD